MGTFWERCGFGTCGCRLVDLFFGVLLLVGDLGFGERGKVGAGGVDFPVSMQENYPMGNSVLWRGFVVLTTPI